MKERGKAVETYTNASDFNYSAPETLCRKHPSSSSVGICAFCLKEKLVKLVCNECGEQRLSSCSCSDISSRRNSSYRNSTSTAMEMGSVGRISFLIDNDKTNESLISSKNVKPKSEEVIFLRRSSSSCVEVKKSNGFWKIKRLFRKKKNRESEVGKNGELIEDDKSETWVSDIMGVSRSRSLCSFRDDQTSTDYASAKISDVTSGVFFDLSESEPRKSGLGFGLIEPRKSGFNLRGGVYPVKESDFTAMDESAFIDINLDHLSDSPNKNIDQSSGINNGGSCRYTMSDNRGLKKMGSKGHKVWKWIFRHHQSGNYKEENCITKP